MVVDASAVGLAANILQFIQFSFDLISDAKELSRSAHGLKAESVELKIIAESLSRLSATLIIPLDPSTGAVPPSEHDIHKLANSAKAVADKLLATLQGLQVIGGSHRKWRSFRQALKSVWHKDEIKNLEKRLEHLLRSLDTQLLLQMNSFKARSFQTWTSRPSANKKYRTSSKA